MSAQAISLLTLTRTLSGTVAANRFVTPAGAQATAGANVIGATRFAGVSGDKVPVDALGTAIVEAGAAVAANATVGSDASGRAVTYASGARVGIALDAAAAAGDLIEVMLLPNAA